jgi:peptidyl-prolyl cis-trans isomerase D
MLNGLRKAGQSLVGKIIAATLFGILIVSFAIWGIGDIFRGGPRNTVAQVGRTEITVDQFRSAFNNELQRLGRQFRTAITVDQARAFGLDQNVLARLINEAVLDERARALGLSVSDETVLRSIIQEPAFRGANGQFDRRLFEDALRNASLSEAGFVRDQRSTIARLHLIDSLTGDMPVSVAAREALHRFGSERRSTSYLILPPTAAGDIPAPTDEQLQSFFTDRQASFRAPEYRSLNVIAIDADTVAKPETVSDADARQRYEQTKSRYGTPERRTIEQIVFPSKEEAETAFNRIKEGASFETVATERNVSKQDLELGTFTKPEVLDPAVADAAFLLQEGAVSGPVEGRFGTVLVRAAQVFPESVRSFEEVAADVKRDLAQERARAELETIHDAVEDMRASARPLSDVAQEKGLKLIQVPAIDRNGRDKEGKPVDAPDRDSVTAAAFASDIGVDNEALRARDGGYVWYEVNGIEPSRDKPLAEVRDEVARQWRENEVAQKLSEKAQQLVERLDKGETLETIAAEVNAQAKTATELARRTAKDDLSADVVNRIFSTPVGKAASAANSADSRAVFKVTAATVSPFLTTTQEAQRIQDQLRDSASDDIIAEYIAELRKEIGVTINQQAVRQVVGGEV